MIGPEERSGSADWLIPFLLIFVRDGRSCGRELVEASGGFDFEVARPAAVYRTLRRLEKERMVRAVPSETCSWPLRRRYEITESGEAYLAFWADAVKRYREEMDTFLELYEGSTKESVVGGV